MPAEGHFLHLGERGDGRGDVKPCLVGSLSRYYEIFPVAYCGCNVTWQAGSDAGSGLPVLGPSLANMQGREPCKYLVF